MLKKIKPLQLLIAVCCLLIATPRETNAYTTVYNGVTYFSPQPYNLNVFYFKPTDVPLDPTYRARLSPIMLWIQNWYKEWMDINGYGPKTFGMYTELQNPDSVRIIVINGAHDLNYYRAIPGGVNGNDYLVDEVNAFKAAHPELMTSDHSIIFTATPGLNYTYDLPFFGEDPDAYLIDNPDFNIEHIDENTNLGDHFVKTFGGTAHELAHGMNLPHSSETRTEHFDSLRGNCLLNDGNLYLTRRPTFLNRASCSVLNNCQLFAQVPDTTFYNGHQAGIKSLHTHYSNGNLIVSGRFFADRTVTEVSFFQDPGPYDNPTEGYKRVAFSAPPIGADSFYMSMPVNEVMWDTLVFKPTGSYNLEIMLALKNGEIVTNMFPLEYTDNVPVSTSFADSVCNQIPAAWSFANISSGTTAFPGTACYRAVDGSVTLRSWGIDGVGSGLVGTTDNASFMYRTIGLHDTLVARVNSNFGSGDAEGDGSFGDPAAFGGIMIRNSLAPDSKFVAIGSLDWRGVAVRARTTTSGTIALQPPIALSSPMWLKLVRSANNFYAYYSLDNNEWTLYKTWQVEMGSTVYAGIAGSGQGTRAVFDKIKLGNATLSVNNINNVVSSVDVYPNPASSSLHVQFSAKANTTVNMTLLDISGKTILLKSQKSNPGVNNATLNVEGLAPGMYMLRIQADHDAPQVIKVSVDRN